MAKSMYIIMFRNKHMNISNEIYLEKRFQDCKSIKHVMAYAMKMCSNYCYPLTLEPPKNLLKC